jgi:hypothetical protein
MRLVCCYAVLSEAARAGRGARCYTTLIAAATMSYHTHTTHRYFYIAVPPHPNTPLLYPYLHAQVYVRFGVRISHIYLPCVYRIYLYFVWIYLPVPGHGRVTGNHHMGLF